MLKLSAISPRSPLRGNGLVLREAVAGLALAAALGCAQTGNGGESETPPIPTEPTELTIQALVSPGENPLADFDAARQESDDFRLSASVNWVAGLWFSELGSFSEAARRFTPFDNSDFEEAPEDGQCDDSELPDGVEEICRLMTEVDPDTLKENPEALPPQYFFIEDRPNFPMMRVFGQRLLECAKDAGFRFFAVEALREEGSAVQARGYVTRSSGVYTREPQMAKLVERAIELEFDLVSYDTPDRAENYLYAEDVRNYAEQQADNLLSKTFEVDPEARMLVWTSPRNARRTQWRVNEDSVIRTNSVAARVWDATGIEPYSMDQIALEPGLDFGAEPASGGYLAAGPDNGACAGAFYPTSDVRFVSSLNGIVMHPVPDERDARWEWLRAADEERMSVTPSCSGCASTTELLVQAFVAGQDQSERIPADQVVCRSGSTCQLVLTPGDYDFAVWSVSERVGAQTASMSAGGELTLAF